MLKFMNAFRNCQGRKHTGAKSLLPRQLQGTKLFLAARTGLALGLICLPVGLGCRSGAPHDWVGQRVAMSESWNEQSNYLRGEGASFQEGWRRGYQDGQAGAGQVSPEREPAQFEAFMNSKREEAVQDWRRGYDAGFTSAFQNSDQHQSHAQLFPSPAGHPDAALSQPLPHQSSVGAASSHSLFGIPRNQEPKPERELVGADSEPKPTKSPTPAPNLLPQVSGPTLTKDSNAPNSERLPSLPTDYLSPQKPHSFDNAGELLDSVIKKNAETSVVTEGTPSVESPDASTNTEPMERAPSEQPNTEETEPTDGASPKTERSIQELPLDDDDVAGGIESQVRPRAMSVLESAKNSPSPSPNDATEIDSRLTSQIRSNDVPPAYEGRLQSGLVVANRHVSIKNSQRQQPVAVEQPSVSTNFSAGYTQTTSTEFAATAPIATQVADTPILPVNHEAQSDHHATDFDSAIPTRLPKGLPLKTRSSRR